MESATELLLHFDSRGQADATGNYTIIGNGPALSSSLSAVGGASAAFTGDRQGVALGGAPGGMFSMGAVWGDFTIEFWLYPATLADGESLLSWNGSDRGASSQGSQLLNQGIVCFIRDRRLVWDFTNLFKLPGAGSASRSGSPPRGRSFPAPGIIISCVSTPARGCWSTGWTGCRKPSRT